MRYKILVEYDGCGFHGWQSQNDLPSVQSVLEDAIYKLTKEHCKVFGGGRTDSGVHATGQVAHFDIEREYHPMTIMRALNHWTRPYPISILDVVNVPISFHARFSAIQRHYRYVIINRAVPSSLYKNRAWHVPKPLDVRNMQIAANYLTGQHDFSSFRATHCQALSPIKTLDTLSVTMNQDMITIHASAKSFLHNQIRIIVGTLVNFSNNNIPSEQMLNVLHVRDRTKAGVTAPAYGLYLEHIDYLHDL